MYFIREQNEDWLYPQNAALACTIKGNPTNGTISNRGLQPLKCKLQWASALICNMIATKTTQETTIKVTLLDGNLTREIGSNGGLQDSNYEFQLMNNLLWHTIANIVTQPTTSKFTSQARSRQKTQVQKENWDNTAKKD